MPQDHKTRICTVINAFGSQKMSKQKKFGANEISVQFAFKCKNSNFLHFNQVFDIQGAGHK